MNVNTICFKNFLKSYRNIYDNLEKNTIKQKKKLSSTLLFNFYHLEYLKITIFLKMFRFFF